MCKNGHSGNPCTIFEVVTLKNSGTNKDIEVKLSKADTALTDYITVKF